MGRLVGRVLCLGRHGGETLSRWTVIGFIRKGSDRIECGLHRSPCRGDGEVEGPSCWQPESLGCTPHQGQGPL